MAEEIKVVAQPRKEQGTGAVRQLRKSGRLPGVVYGSGKKAQNIEFNEHDFESALRRHASEHVIIDLQIGDHKPKKVLLKEVQHHPVTGKIMHADFHEISMTRKLRIGIPVELAGEPEGVTQQGGVLEHLVREVEVECLPMDILERIDVDVSALMIGDSLLVKDIDLDSAKYTILTAPDVAIAAVAAPRVIEEPEPEEEAEALAEGAEPEVIGEGEAEEGKEAPAKEKGGE